MKLLVAVTYLPVVASGCCYSVFFECWSAPTWHCCKWLL